MRRVVGAVALLALLVFPSACAKKQNNGSTTLPPVTVTTSATPTASPTPTGPVCFGTLTGGTDPSAAVLKAWLCGDSATVSAKSASTAVTQLNAVPKDIDESWTYIFCEGAMGSSYCTYRNTPGSQLIFRSQNAPPNKVTEVQFDRTIYNTNPVAYVKHFVDAWIAGNVQRMQALATPAVVAFVASHGAPPTIPYGVALDGANTYKVTFSGGNYTVKINPSLLGKPQAVTDLY